MRGKAIGTSITAALMLSSMLTMFPVNAVSADERGTLTVTVIDEETNELFVEDRDCFGINGGSIHLGSWNPSKSNPYTVTDVQTSFEYVVQYTAKDYDGYTYYIDTEKGEPMISFADATDKEVTVYMKKNVWGSSSDTTTPETPVSTELKTFEELYALEENELKQYCTDHKINYISPEEAKNQIANKCGINIMVKPNDYLINADGDLLESEDLSAFNKSNFADYDFGKMVSDLQYPESDYKFDSAKNDFAFYSVSEPDNNGNPKQKYLKLAQVHIDINTANSNRSSERLYQLMAIWAEQNPIVYTVSLEKVGTSPDKVISDLDTIRSMITKYVDENNIYVRIVPIEENTNSYITIEYFSKNENYKNLITAFITESNIDPALVKFAVKESSGIKGDANCDGELNIADVILLQKWLLAVPNTYLADWKAADLCEDNRLDVFDLCLMKRALLEKMNDEPQNVDTSFKFQSVTDIRYNDDNHTKWTGFIARSENDLINILTENEGVSADKASIEGIDSNTFKDKSVVIVYSICTAGNSYSIIDNISVKGKGIDVATVSKKPMVATPDMLFRRYVYLIDKNAVTDVSGFTFNDTSSYFQYDEETDVIKWFNDWCQAQ